MSNTVNAVYDGSFSLYFQWHNPDAKEITAFEAESPCEFRFVEIENVIFYRKFI